MLMALLICCTCDTLAQVRVKRVRNRFTRDKPRKIHPANPEKDQEKRRKQKNATPYVSATTMPEKRNDLDAFFYVKWRQDRRLQYSDFVYNRNLYNKFLPARDTDLTNTIYPDYRDFYKRLNERLGREHTGDDSLWQARAEKLLREKKEVRSEDMFSAGSIDSTNMFPITIDSPAASFINIQPVIYAVGDDRYYYNITALFSKQDSWMIVRSKDILEHEQVHFDIFELYARKMRRYVIETIRTNYNNGTMANVTDEIAAEFEKLFTQLYDLHIEFDRQTAALTATNSSLIATNAIWKKAMQQQLAQLAQYAIAEGTIRLE